MRLGENKIVENESDHAPNGMGKSLQSLYNDNVRSAQRGSPIMWLP